MIKLYGRRNSSNVRKVLWLIGEIGLDVEQIDYGRGFRPTASPEYLALNPNALVPTFEEDGFILWESHAILRYLAAQHAPQFYPEPLAARAIVDQWLDWELGNLQPPMGALFFGLIVGAAPFNAPERIAEAHSALVRWFTILNDQLGKTDAYAAGEAFSIADCANGVMVHRWFALDIERPPLPALRAYYERLCERPAFQASVLGEP